MNIGSLIVLLLMYYGVGHLSSYRGGETMQLGVIMIDVMIEQDSAIIQYIF